MATPQPQHHQAEQGGGVGSSSSHRQQMPSALPPQGNNEGSAEASHSPDAGQEDVSNIEDSQEFLEMAAAAAQDMEHDLRQVQETAETSGSEGSLEMAAAAAQNMEHDLLRQVQETAETSGSEEVRKLFQLLERFTQEQQSREKETTEKMKRQEEEIKNLQAQLVRNQGTGSMDREPGRREHRPQTMTDEHRYKWGGASWPAGEPEDPVSKELNDMKIATLYNMRKDIRYQAADAQWICPFLYLTNLQANRIPGKKMPRIREVMEVEGYKMVIRLFPSRYGPLNDMTFPFEKCKYPLRTLGDQEHKLSEHLTLFAQKVILPLALKTGALIICNDSCDLASAFLRVAAPVQRRLGDECPFKVLLFLRAPHFDLLANDQSSRIHNFKMQCPAWLEKGEVMETARKKLFGTDDVYHPHSDLVPGDYVVIMFESLSNTDISDEVGNTFQNNFVSSLADSHPVIGIQTLGTNKMSMMPTIADHVSRGLPLMLLDSHDRSKYRSALIAPELLDGKEDELTKRLQLCQDDLTNLAEEWKQKGMMDRHTTSMVAYVKSIVAQSEHAKKGGTKQKNIWIWQAIEAKRSEEVTLSQKSELAEYGSGSVDDPEDPLRFATNMVMKQAGDLVAWEGAVFRGLSDNTLKKVLKEASDWNTFAKQLEDKRNWMDLRATCFFHDQVLQEFAAANKEWCYVDMMPIEGKSTQTWLVVRPDVPRHVDFPKAKKDFEALCLKEIDMVEAYDKRRNSVDAYIGNRDIWLAVYEILTNTNVHTENLYHLSGCEKKLLSLAQNIDRLPQENTLASLILLRRAWILVDLFDGNAKFYKFITKLSYLLSLVTGVAVITVTTLRTIYRDEVITDDEEQYALLGLALLMSAINGTTTVFEPSRKWMHLRGGELALEKEIWRFRTRVGPYSMSSLSRVGAGREAELAFQEYIHGVHEKVLQSAGLKETDFFSISTCTDDVHGYFEDESGIFQAAQKVAPQAERTAAETRKKRIATAPVGQTKNLWVSWMDIYHRHHQYPDSRDSDRPVLRGEDNHHSPATSFDYIRFRIMSEKRFYEKRIPRYAWRRKAFQLVALAMSLTAAFLAAMAWHRWTTILTIIGGSCAAWQEFTGLSKKLERYSTVASSLDSILMWWQTLPTVDQSIVHHVEALVERTESLLGTEHAAWLSDAQQIHRLNVASQEKQRNETRNAKADRESNRELQTWMQVVPPHVPEGPSRPNVQQPQSQS